MSFSPTDSEGAPSRKLHAAIQDMNRPMHWGTVARFAALVVPVLLLYVRDQLAGWPSSAGAWVILLAAALALVPAMGSVILLAIPWITRSINPSLRHWARIAVAILIVPLLFFAYASVLVQLLGRP